MLVDDEKVNDSFCNSVSYCGWRVAWGACAALEFTVGSSDEMFRQGCAIKYAEGFNSEMKEVTVYGGVGWILTTLTCPISGSSK